MKVFKFGGASVKDAPAFQNLFQIVKERSNGTQLLLVVSAMGKTTNALELIFDLAYRKQNYQQALTECQTYHLNIAEKLSSQRNNAVYERLNQLFSLLEQTLATLPADVAYNQAYDQVVSYGELFSSTILHYYLLSSGLSNNWIDSRKYICTDNNWREAKVDWTETERMIKQELPSLLENQILVTQGFLGGTKDNLTTTLGREGSDYSAAIFAYCLDAEEMIIWKDVEGLLNADPKHFAETVRYPIISYHETIEMAYYGASVIHPKTIKPLADKCIPLYVKSFLNPAGDGTKICDCTFDKIAPAYIIKENQCLISFGARDFSFISEKNLGTIFNTLSELRIKINLMQNSAISFSICIDYHRERLELLLQTLREQFIIYYNSELTLYTIKNYDNECINNFTRDKNILMEQRTRTTYQFVSN